MPKLVKEHKFVLTLEELDKVKQRMAQLEKPISSNKRAKQIWTQQDLADQAHVDLSTAKRFLGRKNEMGESSFRALIQALGFNPDEFSALQSISDMGIDKIRSASKRMLEDLKRLTTEALTAGDGIRFDFDDIFVPLGVVERKEKTKRKEDDGAPDRGSELYEEKVTPITHKDFFEDVLLRGNTKNSNGKRIAVIGEAGAGKTTQLQKIASWLLGKSDDIPIWISLTELGTIPLEEFIFENWVRNASGKRTAPQAWKGSLEEAIASGKVWLLLDGVDEMTVSNPLSSLATQLKESWLKNVRVVLTCRVNVWDGDKNALTDFDVYRNLDFDYPNDVYEFISKWFAHTPELGESLTQALEQSGKERIRDMVKNPLRLTLLCYSWQLKQGELPETKAGLYEWFVEAFYKWNKGKAQIELSRSQEEKLNRALGELAKRAIDGETSRFRLTKTFIENILREFDIDLFDLALKLNWLNEIGVAAEDPLETVYAFYHPSFQEYFAALAINDWKFLIDHNPDYPEKGTYRIFNTQWREVIFLWIGRLNIKDYQKDDFLEALINFDNKFWNVYSLQAYLLAAFCVSEWEQCKFTERIFSQIIEWAVLCNFCKFNIYVRDALLKMNDRLVIKGLTKLINSKVTTDVFVDRLSAILLINRDRNNKTAIQTLIRLTESKLRIASITSEDLRNLFSRYNFHTNPPIRLNQWIKIHQWLYSRKKNHINNFFKLTAASCLIGFRSYHKKALAIIKKYGNDDYNKLRVAESLANKNCFYNSIEDITTEVLQNSDSKYTKLWASEILLNIGRKIMIATYQIVSTIEDEFETDVDQDTFLEVPKLLLKASEYPEAKVVIISRLKSFIASSVKNNLEVIIAIQSLILIQGNDNPESLILTQRLFDIILTDIVKDFRIDAAQALIKIGGRDINVSVIRELIYLLPPTLDCEEKKFKDESLNGQHETFFQQDIFGCITQIFEQKLLTAEEYIKSLQSIFNLYDLGIINIDKDLCFSLLWHSSETISYPDFYRLFYSQFNSIYHQNKDNEHIVCKLESGFLDCDVIQKELDRTSEHPEIRCLVVDISHLEKLTDQNLLSKRIWNGLQKQFPDFELPKVNDIGDLEYELDKLQRKLGKKLAIAAIYGSRTNEAIEQLCQNLTQIKTYRWTGEKDTQKLIANINAWLSELNVRQEK